MHSTSSTAPCVTAGCLAMGRQYKSNYAQRALTSSDSSKPLDCCHVILPVWLIPVVFFFFLLRRHPLSPDSIRKPCYGHHNYLIAFDDLLACAAGAVTSHTRSHDDAAAAADDDDILKRRCHVVVKATTQSIGDIN